MASKQSAAQAYLSAAVSGSPCWAPTALATSTLEVIEGLALPTAGTVRVPGHDPYRARRLVRPRIGIMLQDAGFSADLTVTETGRL